MSKTMFCRILIENVVYTFDQLWGSPSQVAGNDVPMDDRRRIVRLLRNMSVGRRNMLAKLDGNRYQFRYVGVVAVHECVFAILPKYYAPQSASAHDITMQEAIPPLVDVLEAIERYAKDNQQDKILFNPVMENVEVEQNTMGLYRSLLEDYAEYGAYTNTRQLHEYNGDGEIDWTRTIARVAPVMQRHRPAYMEMITSRRTHEQSNVIARIQQAMVTEISNIVATTGMNAIFRLPLMRPSTESLADLGGVSYLISVIEKERSVQFETRKKMLLHNMLLYLSSRSPAECTKVFAEGTGSFNLVWEGICKSVFADDGADMPHPRWTYRTSRRLLWPSGNSVHDTVNGSQDEKDAGDESDAQGTRLDANVHTLIPDVVTNVNDTECYILDAKYYVPRYRDADGNGKGGIAGAPGISDIIKQYFYMMALQNRNDHPRKVLGNAFIIPGRISPGERDTPFFLAQRGHVSLDFMKDVQGNLHRIPMFEMNPEQAIRLYISGNGSKRNALHYLRLMFPEPRHATDPAHTLRWSGIPLTGTPTVGLPLHTRQ
ncbi:LlaJI family restriction endonuclease [Bifidobacterium biavatii]|uniref:Restriction endonuclease, type II, LlaJI n=1 Tax=Bifidobacterium biavatii DSM 23969 TaxID=1437608 RepID=A0A087A1T7_9BIFI|nr:LlaJI family restriction endonuclease [Bifidobacterium biavatii]KFI52737.1 Restriction endonuclease, type II, LlaJI [Bifidobacterium biavatii DSM 23969]